MKMSLSPTNCRTVPDASVLTITLGTPSGTARIAAVAIVVPADPPRPRMPRHLAPPAGLARQPGGPCGGPGHRLAAVGLLPHRLERRARQLEDALAGDVRCDRGRAKRTDVHEGDAHAPRREETADEVGLAALRIERCEKEDGRHPADNYTHKEPGPAI